VETDLAPDLETLHHEASALKVKADAAVRTYDRETWIRLALVFFPIPFVVLLVRLHLEAWGYYAAGGFLIASVALLVRLDGAAAAKRDSAVRAADGAQQAYDEARAARNAP
jgi:hypothetical protein